MRALLFYFFLFLFGTPLGVFSQEEEQQTTTDEEQKTTTDGGEEEQQQQQTPPEEGSPNNETEETIIINHPDVAVSYVFPNNPEKRFVAGQEAEILLGVKNFASDRSINISVLEASLRHPQDFRYFIQNFTQDWYEDMIVGPLQEIALSYYFIPNELLEPRDFGFVAEVFYVDMKDDAEYFHTFFNGTLDVIEPPGSLDAQTFFTYSGAIAVIGLLGFLVFKLISNWKKRARKSKTQGPGGFVEYGTVSVTRHQKNADVSENEWLTGTSADGSQKSKKKTQPARRKK